MKKIEFLLPIIFVILCSSCTPTYIKELRKLDSEFAIANKQIDNDIEKGLITKDVGKNFKKQNNKSRKKLLKMNADYYAEKNPIKRREIGEFIKTNIVIYKRTLLTLKRIYKLNKFRDFKTSLLYDIGKYKIGESAKPILAPLVLDIKNQILNELQDAETNKLLKVVIIVSGHSDEAAIDPKSELAKDLAIGISSKSPSMKELNEELSSRRAKALVEMIRDEIESDKQFRNRNIRYEINEVPRGYDLPYKLTDFQRVDERRRVVTVTWNVLSDF